jgi:uncharacterized protein YbaR (Trm112 family)
MKRDLLDILACPEDKSSLQLTEVEADGDEVVTGTLACTQCGAEYPIESSIPNLLPLDLREAGPSGL